MTFSEVIGQKEVQERLKQMVKEGHLPHAIMLCGPTGSGKMALAVAFASYLLGEDNSMVKKLENTTDTDFAGVDFTVYDDEDNEDNDEEADHE